MKGRTGDAETEHRVAVVRQWVISHQWKPGVFSQMLMTTAHATVCHKRYRYNLKLTLPAPARVIIYWLIVVIPAARCQLYSQMPLWTVSGIVLRIARRYLLVYCPVQKERWSSRNRQITTWMVAVRQQHARMLSAVCQWMLSWLMLMGMILAASLLTTVWRLTNMVKQLPLRNMALRSLSNLRHLQHLPRLPSFQLCMLTTKADVQNQVIDSSV